MKHYHVYILANARRGKFYTGITSNLVLRMAQHRAGTSDAYTKLHNIRQLVWYETHGDVNYALRREKRIKRWTRVRKISVVEEINPDWRDLSYGLGGAPIADCPLLPR